MKKYLQKLKKNSTKFYKENSDEIESLKTIRLLIYKYKLFLVAGTIGFFFAVVAIWFNAEVFLKKSKNARLKSNKLRFLKIANAYAVILFAVGFAITMTEIFTNLLL